MEKCECGVCYFADVVTDDDEWSAYHEVWCDEHLTAELLDARRRLADLIGRVDARLASLMS